MPEKEDHEEIVVVPTDFLRIEQELSESESLDAFENFTLELFSFLSKTFPEAFLSKGDLYPDSIGCDIQYLGGDMEELFKMLHAAQKEFKIPLLKVETDLFDTHRDEILETFVDKSQEIEYDPSMDFIHVRQIIQHVYFDASTQMDEFKDKASTFDATILHAGLTPRSEFPRKFVPPYFYSEVRTNHIEM